MTKILLRTLSVFIFLGPAEFEGSRLFAFIRLLFRVSLVAILALLLVQLVINGWRPSWVETPTAEEISAQVCIALEFQGCDTPATSYKLSDDPDNKWEVIAKLIDTSAATGESGSALSTTHHPPDPRSVSLLIECKDGENWRECDTLEGLDTNYRLAVHVTGRETKTALVEIRETSIALFNWPKPTRTVSFDASPFVISAMLLDAPSVSELSSQEKSVFKQNIDQYLSELPSARSDKLVWPRRLVGEIQLLSYFLFGIATILLLLHILTNLAPNNLARRNLQKKLNGSKGSAPDFINLLEKERKHLREMSGLLGARPTFPAFDIRLTGFYALKATKSGEAIPSFVSVTTDAAAERLDAQHRIIGYLIWAIPTLGFIGTVLGIGDALLQTVDLQSGVPSAKAIAENGVSVKIGVAFDTTLVALGLSFTLMLALSIIQYFEEAMLAREKRDTLSTLLHLQNIGHQAPAEQLSDILQNLAAKTALANNSLNLFIKSSRSIEKALEQIGFQQSSGNKGLPLTLMIVVGMTLLIGFGFYSGILEINHEATRHSTSE